MSKSKLNPPEVVVQALVDHVAEMKSIGRASASTIELMALASILSVLVEIRDELKRR